MYQKEIEILKLAQKKQTAVIGFICMDYLMARSVVYSAEATKTPAIVMLYPEHVRDCHSAGFKGYSEMVKELANEVSVPIALHMDHDYEYDSVMHSINNGFESVMIDGSMKNLEDNITLTKKVVDKAHSLNVCVEGEIGCVGSAENSDNNNVDLYTNVEAVERFCKETCVDSLAVSIGNAHGKYNVPPKLDIKRLKEIRKRVDTPLVLHGGSGIGDDQLKLAFSNGITKLNLGMDFLKMYFSAVAEFTSTNIENEDPVKIINLPKFVQNKLQFYLEERLRTLCNF